MFRTRIFSKKKGEQSGRWWEKYVKENLQEKTKTKKEYNRKQRNKKVGIVMKMLIIEEVLQVKQECLVTSGINREREREDAACVCG